MDRHAHHYTLGGAVFGVGAAALVTLLVTPLVATRARLLANPWYDFGIGVSALFVVVGLYVLTAPLTGVPMPTPREQPFWRRKAAGSALPLTAAGPPILDVEPCVQGEDVYLKVVNQGSPGEFAARVTRAEGFDRSLATPWVIPWRDGTGEWERVAGGEYAGRLLRLATTDGMGSANAATVRENLLSTLSWMWRFRTLDGELPARVAPRGSALLDVVIARTDGQGCTYRVEVGFEVAGYTPSGNLRPRAAVDVERRAFDG